MNPKTKSPESKWFGFREVNPAAKTGLVRDVFERVAGRYDLMNDLMSGGVHRLWKASLITQMRPRGGQRLLDVAGGTGDITFRALKAAPGLIPTLCDINPAMLSVGRDKAIDRGYVDKIAFVVGNAEQLPVKSRSVDLYTIAFGLRNVTVIDAALAEARRVLKPGGRFYCLEFSHVAVPGLDKLYDRYSFSILPRLGQFVARDREAYQYLVESIRKFPAQEALAKRMQAAGLGQVRVRNLSGGIAAIHSAWRL